MIPIAKIRIGDVFTNPTDLAKRSAGPLYLVLEVNTRENMVLIQALSGRKAGILSSPFWKKNTESPFFEGWRI